MNKEIINPKIKKTVKKELEGTASNIIVISTLVTAITNLINTSISLWKGGNNGK